MGPTFPFLLHPLLISIFVPLVTSDEVDVEVYHYYHHRDLYSFLDSICKLPLINM